MMYDEYIANAMVNAKADMCTSSTDCNCIAAEIYNPFAIYTVHPAIRQIGKQSEDADRGITKNRVSYWRGNVASASYDKDGVLRTFQPSVMPDITDVKTIENDGQVKVVTVFFADGTSEKAVLSPDDNYSLEQGISVCITKKLLSAKTGGHGSAVYNKIINHALKVMQRNRENEAKQLAEDEAVREKLDNLAKKKASKKAKRLAAAREEAIAIQKEAYLRAMREYNGSTGE